MKESMRVKDGHRKVYAHWLISPFSIKDMLGVGTMMEGVINTVVQTSGVELPE